jgi:hypothetical protein
MSPDNQNQTQDTDQSNVDRSLVEKKIKREKAEDQVAREREEEIQEYKEGDKGSIADRLKANLERYKKDLSFRAKREAVEKKTEEMELTEEEKDVLNALESQLGREEDELIAVYETLGNSSVLSKIEKYVKNEKLSAAIGAVIGSGIGSIVKSSSISRGIRGSIGFVLSGPVVGGLVGGAAAGAVSSGFKERERVHQVKSWEEESGISEISDPDFDLDQAMELEIERLDQIAGVLSNAFTDRKVRDNTARTLRLATKYRIVKEAILRKEEGEDSREGEIFAKLDALEAVDSDVDSQILSSAAETHKDTYKEILKDKKKRIWKKMAYGALFGGSIGAITGGVFDSFMDTPELPSGEYIAENNRDWFEDHLLKIGIDPQTGAEVEPNVDYTKHLDNINHQWAGFGEFDLATEQYNTDWEAFNKFAKLIEDGKMGFNEGVDSPVEEALQMGWQHNIDLLAPVDEKSLTMADFLNDNKDWFAGLDPREQKYLISHPGEAINLLNRGFEQVEQLKPEYSFAYSENSISNLRNALTVAIGIAGVIGSRKLSKFESNIDFNFSGKSFEINSEDEEDDEEENEVPSPPTPPPAEAPVLADEEEEEDEDISEPSVDDLENI